MRRVCVLVLLALAVNLTLTGAQEASGASVAVEEHEEFGRYLTDSEGRSLYLFTNDERGGPSTCYEQCAENWPPFTVEGEPSAGEGAAPSLLGTVERDDGSMQVTYYGWPLYYFARDAEPGDTAGHGVGGVWYLVSPYGEAIEAPEEEGDGAEGEAGGEPAAAEGVDTEEATGEEDEDGDAAGGEAEGQEEAGEADAEGAVEEGEGGEPAAAEGVDTEDVTGEEDGEGAEQDDEQEGDQEGEQEGEPEGEGNGAGDGAAAEIPSDVMNQGRTVYRQNCATCHGNEGGGGSGPRLAGNDNLADEAHVINRILNGGSFMPPFRDALNDEQIAAVSTFIRNSWENSYGLTTPEEVSEAR